MCRQILAGVWLLYLTTSALAEPVQEPAGPSPYLMIVTAIDRSEQTITLTEKAMIEEEREKAIENELTGEQETVTETVWVMRPISMDVPYDRIRMYTAGKKRADIAALKPGMAVLTVEAGHRIDARYLELFKDDVLILVIPEDVIEDAIEEADDIIAPPPPVIDDMEAPAPPAPVIDPSA